MRSFGKGFQLEVMISNSCGRLRRGDSEAADDETTNAEGRRK